MLHVAVLLGRGGETTGIIGRNGMGKSTLCQRDHGTAAGGGPAGRSLLRRAGDPRAGPSYDICRTGLAYVPQGRRIFPSLSTDEHLRMLVEEAGHPRQVDRRRGSTTSIRGWPSACKVGAAQLSGGEQQMLAIGRALLTNPQLLIMDEPSEGLAPTIVEQLTETCRTLVAEGVTLLLVEQNLGMATAVADRLLVMVHGEVALETTSAELLADEDMQRRYLGVEPAGAH